ncbi:MAG TPA: PBP1A family penicillin-binding protein [Patescibacteria group bacterium]
MAGVMRILLWLFFPIIILLILIEKLITNLLVTLKKLLLLLWKMFKKQRSKQRKKQFSMPFRTKIKYFIFGIVFAFLFIFPPLLISVFLQDLPTPQELTLRQIPQTTKIYDRHGVLLAEDYAQQNRTLIHLADVPLNLQHATLAIEDKNFYKHPGFDVSAIIRAFRQTFVNNTTQGGSTITQQLIKSSILSPEQTFSRKFKEIILAFWAEKIYTKNQILEMYFNQVPYGGTAWGVEAASETYFDKPVNKLTLAESAFLAGLTSAPTAYSPYGQNPTAWKKRQEEVLSRMVDLRYITQNQAEEATKQELHFRPQQSSLHAPHFVEYVKEQLAQKYGLPAVEKGGLQVTTTLDLKIQEMAEKVVKEEVANDGNLNLTNGAVLITDPKTGEILAMVGSHDFDDPNGGNFNVTTSLRQPGSSIKVVTYSTALRNGFTAATILDDSPIAYPLSDGQIYAPVNYDGRFHGRVSLRTALANSLNIPAVKTLDAVGISSMVNLGKAMGIENWSDPQNYGLSITLGAADVTMLDMARVNGVLANKGQLVELNPFLKVTDIRNATLEDDSKPPVGKQVLDPGVTFILSDILADNKARAMEFGDNSPLVIPGHTVSVKTGTTDDKRDNWTNGYTDKAVVIVWVGNNDNSPMSPTLASGITGAAPIWHRLMEELLKKNPETIFSPPTDVIQKFCNGRQEYFLKGTENTVNCSFYKPLLPSIFPSIPLSPVNILPQQ